MRAAETNTVQRLDQCFADLKCTNILGLGEVTEASNVLGPRRGQGSLCRFQYSPRWALPTSRSCGMKIEALRA